MPPRTTIQKTISLLAHPASLAALLLLALNDFILKPYFPSGLSGKLSDFALLFLLPFLVIPLTAWVFKGNEKAAAALAFALVGGAFSLLKLVPAAGAALTAATARLGLPLFTLPDPSDLIALSVLLPAWLLWNSPSRLAMRRLAKPAWLLLPLAAALTLADAAMPDQGITCFVLNDRGGIETSTTYSRRFQSTDGGLTWTASSAQANFTCPDHGDQVDSAGPSGALSYRYLPGQVIERSQDGGQTWEAVYSFGQVSEAQQAYIAKTLPTNRYYVPGPLHGIYDPASGNVVFAMGLEGVLVYTQAGEWQWVAVSDYHRLTDQPMRFSDYAALLWGESFLALFTWMLAFSTLALTWHIKRTLRIVKVVIGWLGWLLAVFAFPAAIMNGAYAPGMVFFAYLVLGIYAAASLVDDLISLGRRTPGRLVPLAGASLISAVVFIIPYALWAFNVIADYAAARLAAVILVLIALAAGFFINKQQSPGQNPGTNPA